MYEAEVKIDLEAMKGDKSKLMQQYSEEQRKIIDSIGGNISDIPIDTEHPYYQLQKKIQALHYLDK